MVADIIGAKIIRLDLNLDSQPNGRTNITTALLLKVDILEQNNLN